MKYIVRWFVQEKTSASRAWVLLLTTAFLSGCVWGEFHESGHSYRCEGNVLLDCNSEDDDETCLATPCMAEHGVGCVEVCDHDAMCAQADTRCDSVYVMETFCYGPNQVAICMGQGYITDIFTCETGAICNDGHCYFKE